MKKYASFSPDRVFRYTLERVWDETKPLLLVVMLNPSTADEQDDDPTITRLIVRAKSEGFGRLCVCNLFAFRSPSPKALVDRVRSNQDVIGQGNSQMITECALRCDAALVAWGAHRLVVKRDCVILHILYRYAPIILALDKTKDGFPRHPLYVAYDRTMQPYTGRFARLI